MKLIPGQLYRFERQIISGENYLMFRKKNGKGDLLLKLNEIVLYVGEAKYSHENNSDQSTNLYMFLHKGTMVFDLESWLDSFLQKFKIVK